MDSLKRRTTHRKRWDRLFQGLFGAATLFGVVALLLLITDILRKAAGWIDLQFLTSFPSRFAEDAGILSALAGSIWLIGLTAPIALPLGVASAIFLEEFAPQSSLTRLIQVNIANLAGVPSIVFGILGLALFVRALGAGRSLLAGALTMSLLVLPIIIVSAQEAIRAVPDSQRQAALALGATKWQAVRSVVLPAAMPGIMTGTILALSRAIGETAPLIMIGALSFVAFLPSGPLDQFTVLPIQIFNWTSRPQEEFSHVAAAGIVVLLVLLLVLNSAAVLIRNHYRKRFEA